ncbi:MAG: hypothetical protein IH795_00935 [Bacteroidetes bacterium]|nr:hypothetical protein [Bacteroidota bacterium]
MKSLCIISGLAVLFLFGCKKDDPDPDPTTTTAIGSKFTVNGIEYVTTSHQLWYFNDFQTLTKYDRMDIYLVSGDSIQLSFQIDDKDGAVIKDTNTYIMNNNQGNVSYYQNGSLNYSNGQFDQTSITITKFDSMSKKASGMFSGIYNGDVGTPGSATINGTFDNIPIIDF